MKAIDYFDKYGERIFVDNTVVVGAVQDMFVEFMQEVVEICNTRKVVTDWAVASVIKEQNQKWNALDRIFSKRWGFSPLKEDGFIAYCRLELSEYFRAGLI